MGWGATDDGPDIAEMSGRTNPFPQWARRAALAAGIVLILVALYVVRQIESDYELVADPPRFTERHESETEVRLDNPTGDVRFVNLEPPTGAGMRVVDVDTSAHRTSMEAPAEYVVPARTEVGFTLRWHPGNCTAAASARNEPAVLTVLIGGLSGEKEAHRVRLGRWRDIVPPACDDFPDRGVPRLADQPEVTPVTSGLDLVPVELAVENVGGQPLRLTGIELPAGIDPGLLLEPRSLPAPLHIGYTLSVTVDFRPHDCRAPVDGPATVVLRFDTPTTGRVERLEVQLADSWPNLIGTCIGPPPD